MRPEAEGAARAPRGSSRFRGESRADPSQADGRHIGRHIENGRPLHRKRAVVTSKTDGRYTENGWPLHRKRKRTAFFRSFRHPSPVSVLAAAATNHPDLLDPAPAASSSSRRPARPRTATASIQTPPPPPAFRTRPPPPPPPLPPPPPCRGRWGGRWPGLSAGGCAAPGRWKPRPGRRPRRRALTGFCGRRRGMPCALAAPPPPQQQQRLAAAAAAAAGCSLLCRRSCSQPSDASDRPLAAEQCLARAARRGAARPVGRPAHRLGEIRVGAVTGSSRNGRMKGVILGGGDASEGSIHSNHLMHSERLLSGS